MLSSNILIVFLLALALVACKPAPARVLVIEDATPLPSAAKLAEPESLACNLDDLLN